MRPRRHHISHGTLGIAYALAATAHATGRGELMDLALAGVAAGIVRELLRYARIVKGRDHSYAVPWPDQPPALKPTS
jgi:hypothetical protein